jgi:uncharacterized protein
MRNIPLSTGLIILFFYLLISFFGWIAIRNLLSRNKSGHFFWSRLYWVASICQAVSFFLLFIYPFTTSSTTKYALYFIYNSILITDIFSRIPLFMSGLASLVFKRKSVFRFYFSFSGFILSLGLFLIFIWGFTFGPRTLHKNHIELYLSDIPGSFDGFRISQISDTHLGNYHYHKMFERAIEENNIFNPDLLLFTGDLVNNFAWETEGWKDKFLLFEATNKLAVQGNHDYGDYFRWPDKSLKELNFEGILKAFEDFGFTLLSNNTFEVTNGTDTIYITGVENWGHPPFPQYADLEKAVAGIPANTFKILLTHDPAHWESIIKYNNNFSLTFSGHSHGLQWGIKLAGIEFSLIYLSRKTWAGLYEYNGNHLYVNRGLGTIGIPLRIDMPAEITFITLRKK